MSMTPEEKRARQAEYDRRYLEANKEAKVERDRRYFEANKKAVTEQKRRYREANKEALAEQKRRYHRRNGFSKEDGSSFQAWVARLTTSSRVFSAIATLQPDPGQTLTELIHELSGYAMEVCEQIANPPILEGSPALTPPADPDLF